MPLSELGSVPALNQTTSENITRGQDAQIAKQRVADEAIGQVTQPLNQMARNQMDQQAQMIQITPEIANGLSKQTGDGSWQKAVGTKIRANVFTALATIGAKNKHEQDLIDDKDRLADLNNRAKAAIEQSKEDSTAKTQGDKHKDTLENIRTRGEETRKTNAVRPSRPVSAGASSTGEAPKDKEFLKTYRSYQNDLKGFNGTLLAQLAKQDPDRYKELGEKALFLKDNQQRFMGLQGVGTGQAAQPSADDQAKKRGKAIDFLKDKHPELTNPTDADIQWAMGKMNG